MVASMAHGPSARPTWRAEHLNARMTTTLIFPPTRDGLPLGLGGAPLGNMFAPVPEAQVSALFEAALADGCRSLDTAPH